MTPVYLHLDLTMEDRDPHVEIDGDGDVVRLLVQWPGARVIIDLPRGVAITDRRNPDAGDALPASVRRFEWAWAARPDSTPIPYDEQSARDVATDSGGVVLRRPVDVGPWEVASDVDGDGAPVAGKATNDE